MMKRKRTKTSKFKNVFLVLVLVAAFVYVSYQSLYEKQPVVRQAPLSLDQIISAREGTLASLEGKYYEKTVEYYDEEYGFTVRYPIGYFAVQDPLPGVRARFSAYFPPFEAEIIDLRVLNYTDMPKDEIGEMAVEEGLELLQIEQNGRPAYLFSLQEEHPLEENASIYVRQAFFECRRSPQGKLYWLSLTSAVTEALAPDLELAEYMISTVEC